MGGAAYWIKSGGVYSYAVNYVDLPPAPDIREFFDLLVESRQCVVERRHHVDVVQKDGRQLLEVGLRVLGFAIRTISREGDVHGKMPLQRSANKQNNFDVCICTRQMKLKNI